MLHVHFLCSVGKRPLNSCMEEGWNKIKQTERNKMEKQPDSMKK